MSKTKHPKLHPVMDKVITELRRIRLQQGHTQRTLGELMKARQSLIGKVESRIHKDVMFWTVVRIANALGYDLEITLKKRPDGIHILPGHRVQRSSGGPTVNSAGVP